MIEVPIIKHFENVAKNYHDKTAIISKKECIEYEELNSRANQLAHYLRDIGIDADKSIGVCLPISIDMVISVLAIQKLGIPYVPIDARYPKERIDYMICNADISCVISYKNMKQKFDSFRTRCVCLDELDYSNYPVNNLFVTYNEIIYILYTSGSTGNPKGVEVYHNGVANYLQYVCMNYMSNLNRDNEPASFIYLPLSFDASVTSLFAPLMTGRALVIPEKTDLEIFTDELVQKYHFDFVKLTPAHLLLLKEQIKIDILRDWTKCLVIGGEALTSQHLEYFKKNSLTWKIINEYGPTETVVGSSVYEFYLDAPFEDRIPIGKPIDNTEIYIVDENENILSEGNIGEIVIAGAGVAKGYCNNNEMTVSHFKKNFAQTGKRAYKTGDLGSYRSDGNLLYYGRKDNQVKIRGYRIELSDVEEGLKKIPEIDEAAVVVRETEQNTNTLEAFYVSSSEIKPNDIRQKLEEYLPLYMLPSRYNRIEKIPLTTNGKIDRNFLKSYKICSAVNEEKLTNIEKKIIPIWKEQLGIDSFSINDKFSVLGGHSLLAVMLISQLDEMFNVEIPILLLYPNGTLKEIAAEIEKQISIKEGEE